jgi:UDP-N-acetylmuramate--alanine ligase
VQLLWQCGATYHADLSRRTLPPNVHLFPFLDRVDLAYACADIVVARAGAGTISELCLLGKVAILVPSPNVAEDHQTKNARALVDKGAAVMIPDAEVAGSLGDTIAALLDDEARRHSLSTNARTLGVPGSAEKIASIVLATCTRANATGIDARPPHAVYLVGIGGIGMSALARYFKTRGHAVAGYDRVPSPLTTKMNDEEGIPVTYTDDEGEIDETFRNPATLVVYTPAVPPDNRILTFFRANGFVPRKRAEVLGLISRETQAICVAGTHGKTTVSTMTAFLLHSSHVGCNAFLGGISSNFGTNLLVDPASPYTVIEADEFDRSFLHLHPAMAVITSTDADHLDIYGTRERLLEAFGQFAAQTSGPLFVKAGVTTGGCEATGHYSATDGETADYRAERLQVEDEGYRFDYAGPEVTIPGLRLAVLGRVNVENATAAITLALHAGATPDEIREALPRFKGVARRLEVHARGSVTYIDDYAHHPREIEAALTSVREMWPGRRLTVAFQPHLYSRTRDFYPGFAKSLSLADEVILLEIYPAREEPLPGVTSRLIADQLTVPVVLVSREEFPAIVRERVHDGIFMTVGAGDIDRFVPVFTAMFSGDINT